MRRYLALSLLLLFTLCGCAAQTPSEAQTTPPVEEGSRALTQEEAERFNQYFAAWDEDEDGMTARPVGGFFTSTYDDVRDLDFLSFLGRFPGDEVLTDADQAEYEALTALPNTRWDREEFARPSDVPIPIRRLRREVVDQVLEQYAGITAADLTDTSNALYLEDYDAWYVDGDFGGDYFECVGGETDGTSVLLWSAPAGENGNRLELELQKDGADLHIRSFRIASSIGKE